MWFRTWWVIVGFPCNWSNLSCICSTRHKHASVDFGITQCVCQSHAGMISLLSPMQISFRSLTPSIAHAHVPFPALFILVHIFTYPYATQTCRSKKQPSMNSHTCAKSSSGERFDSVGFFLCSPDHHCTQHEATHPYEFWIICGLHECVCVLCELMCYEFYSAKISEQARTYTPPKGMPPLGLLIYTENWRMADAMADAENTRKCVLSRKVP
jgi:hypothetical protein